MDKCKGLLNILGPWCRYIKFAGDFSLNPSEESPTEVSLICWTTINNLFYLTVTFNAIFQHEIEGIWKNVSRSCARNNTFNLLIDAFLLMLLKLGKPKLILFVRTILIYLCRQGSGVALMNALARHLIPENLTVIDIDRLDLIFSSKCIPAKGYFLATVEDAGVESIVESSPVIHLCVEFLMDFMVEVEKVSIIEHLPMLLTICFLLMDSSHHECENMRRLLIVVVSSIFGLKQSDRSRVDSILIALEQRVSQTKQEGKLLWKREESSLNPGILDSTSRMNALAFELLEILSDEYPNLRASWAVKALEWGVNMHIAHISCRSLQLFRNLNSILSFKLCLKLLNTLSKVAGSIDLDTQRYAFELICTASSFLELGVAIQNLVEFKTLFWTGIILLGSCNEWEYICGLNIVHRFCSIASESDDVLTVKILEVPHELHNCFDGALPLLVRGLSSSKADILSLACINAALSESKFLFGSTDRFMFAVLSNLPRLMLKYPSFMEGDMKSLSHDEILQAAELLIRGAEKFGYNSLCKLLKMFSTDKIRSHDEFIANFVYIIIKEYPSFGWDAVRFCISLLSNRNYIYPKCFLEILDLILKDLIRIDLNVNQIDESWIGPLMGALDGRFHTKACSVLDSILSGRIKRNENDITMVVGGAINMHTFVQKTLETAPSEHHENGTGWPFAGNNTSLVQTQLSMLLTTNDIDSQLHITTEKPATAGVSRDKAEALRLVFEDFHNFFSSEVAKLSPPA